MAAKLKLITRPIPWSLLLKATSLAVLWGFGKASLASGIAVPFYLYILLVCAAYFFPLFRPRSLAVPFLCVLIFSIILPFSGFLTLAFAVLFFLILGIKDLTLVNRETAYESLFFVLSFLSAATAYHAAGAWSEARGWMAVAGTSLIVMLLGRKLPWQDPPFERRNIMPVLVFGMLVFEFGLTLLILPMDFLYQASILFMFIVFAAYSLISLRRGEATFETLMYYFLAFGIAAGFILALNSWKL